MLSTTLSLAARHYAPLADNLARIAHTSVRPNLALCNRFREHWKNRMSLSAGLYDKIALPYGLNER
jgi:hypothetical protein